MFVAVDTRVGVLLGAVVGVAVDVLVTMGIVGLGGVFVGFGVLVGGCKVTVAVGPAFSPKAAGKKFQEDGNKVGVIATFFSAMADLVRLIKTTKRIRVPTKDTILIKRDKKTSP